MDRSALPSFRLLPRDLVSAPLAPVLERLRLHALVLREVKDSLPPHLAEHCRDCVVAANQRLIVYADSPAWSFQLRFHAPATLERMATAGRAFRALEFRALTTATNVTQRDGGPRVSLATAELVRTSGSGMESRELSAALERLGKTMAEKAKGHVP